ncbi:hypothetical protein EVJ58_g2716 [Rhodofomes roseus]|uniref:Uncharacterized protein n=1 Tax=Rhodofomes roseus TaxID=34475 RepID=A0A4Y9YRX1_9APHY|nr:hypothetical protein EVJ58_g2716 [Rhodofomes roseus]
MTRSTKTTPPITPPTTAPVLTCEPTRTTLVGEVLALEEVSDVDDMTLLVVGTEDAGYEDVEDPGRDEEAEEAEGVDVDEPEGDEGVEEEDGVGMGGDVVGRPNDADGTDEDVPDIPDEEDAPLPVEINDVLKGKVGDPESVFVFVGSGLVMDSTDPGSALEGTSESVCRAMRRSPCCNAASMAGTGQLGNQR